MTGTELNLPIGTPLLPPTLGSGAMVQHPRDSRVKEMAKEFEAMFVSMLLKEMRQTLDKDEGGGFFAGDTADVQGGLFDMMMSRHIAQTKSIGLASYLETHLKPSSPKQTLHGPTPAAGDANQLRPTD